VLKSGEIQKRGTFNTTYKQRHFQLERSNGRSFLVYYKSNGEKPSGQILLEDAEIELDDRNPKNWRVKTSKRCYYLKCDNQEIRQDWVDSLLKHCSHSLKSTSLNRYTMNKKQSVSSTTSGSLPKLAIHVGPDSPKGESEPQTS